jgi:hypothetical protein
MLLYQDDIGVVQDVTSVKDVATLPSYESVAGQFAYRPIDLANPIYERTDCRFRRR